MPLFRRTSRKRRVSSWSIIHIQDVPDQSSAGFNCTDQENAASLKALRRRSWLALRAKIDEQTSDANILTKLRGNFEERFRYDDNGVPRVRKPEDDIDTAYRKARDQVKFPLVLDICLALISWHVRPSSLSPSTRRSSLRTPRSNSHSLQTRTMQYSAKENLTFLQHSSSLPSRNSSI